MRWLAMAFIAALVLGSGGCGGDDKPQYGFETPLSLPGRTRQTWAVAPIVNLSGQNAVDPILQADLFYQQLQQVGGLNIIPVNRVVEVYASLRIDQVRSEQQAALICELLGCDGLLVATVTAYDPYDPPKLGASLALFARGSFQRPANVDPRELARRAAPSADENLPMRSSFAQVVGMFDAANGSIRARLAQYAQGRNDPSGAYQDRIYLVEMDRYCGFVYHSLIRDLLAKPVLAAGK